MCCVVCVAGGYDTEQCAITLATISFCVHLDHLYESFGCGWPAYSCDTDVLHVYCVLLSVIEYVYAHYKDAT